MNGAFPGREASNFTPAWNHDSWNKQTPYPCSVSPSVHEVVMMCNLPCVHQGTPNPTQRHPCLLGLAPRCHRSSFPHTVPPLIALSLFLLNLFLLGLILPRLNGVGKTQQVVQLIKLTIVAIPGTSCMALGPTKVAAVGSLLDPVQVVFRTVLRSGQVWEHAP